MLNMLRRLDKIRFRGHKRDDFLDLVESPNASDTECGDEIPVKIPRTLPRDSEELRDPVSALHGPPHGTGVSSSSAHLLSLHPDPVAWGWGAALSPPLGGQAEWGCG